MMSLKIESTQKKYVWFESVLQHNYRHTQKQNQVEYFLLSRTGFKVLANLTQNFVTKSRP